ncbi:hypothetical protein D3C78_165990 [compost metagenome]
MTYIIVVVVIALILCYYLPNNPSSGIAEYALYLIITILVIIAIRLWRYSN